MTESEVNVKTPDGVADCYFVHPSSGAHAGVVVWPDILGLRPAFRQMGKRLAESGYSVLVVNPFYRQKRVDKKRKIGTTGYCMGGPIVMRTAAAVPGRVGAGASFHGGGLVTKAPDSPHLNNTSSRLHARSACFSLYTAESGGHQPCAAPAYTSISAGSPAFANVSRSTFFESGSR